MSLVKKQIGSVSFWQKGKKPELLIHSGTHGDEWRVIEILTDYVMKNQDKLPDFIFVPEVSPSAVARKTRKNGNNLDLNRNFADFSDDAEVKANLKIINSYNFKKVISFHEDTEYEEFYLYDSGLIAEKSWQKIMSQVERFDIKMLNGIDDPADPILGIIFKDGYFSTSFLEVTNCHSGTLGEYLVAKKNNPRYFTVEIPTKSTIEQKKKLVNLLFVELVF